MPQDMRGNETALSRREFFAKTGGTVAGAAALGLAGKAEAVEPKPARGGVLRVATRSDAIGLEPHRNNYYYVSVPIAWIGMGLLDLNPKLEPSPGIATEWEASKDLMTYTFKLRKNALFHNGREIDAEAARWNFERMQDPKRSMSFVRASLVNLKEVEVLDKYTLRCHLNHPSAAFPADVVYYPCHLMAPDSEENAAVHPICAGPFKFVKWDRFALTVLERFENFYETDAEGNQLPYLERIEGRPKKEDAVRLTALRAGEVDLIDNMAYSHAQTFDKRFGNKFQTWDIQALGTAYVTFNLDKGPFAYSNPDGKLLRQAAAYATDLEAIHNAVFYQRGDIATSYFPSVSPWRSAPENSWTNKYDPDKAKFLIKKAKAQGTVVDLMAQVTFDYMNQTGELLQAMWSEVGFKVNYNLYDAPILRQKRRKREFHADAAGGSYRFDPDGWFSRQILSNGSQTQQESGFRNERADSIIAEARKTADTKKRLEMYAEVESIINEELPILYTHHLTLLQAADRNLQNYTPGLSGAPSTQGAGVRVAWMKS